MKKYLLALLLVPTVYAMEQDPEEIIHGSLYLEPFQGAWYSIDAQEAVQRIFDIPMEHNEPMLFVTALNGDGSDQIPLFLYDQQDFPYALPLHILKDKKEGETIELRTVDQKKVILTCKQEAWIKQARFEEIVLDNLKRFKRKPKVHLFSQTALEAAHIIKGDENERWQHGVHGYAFDSDLEHDSSSYSDSESNSELDSKADSEDVSEDESESSSWSFSSDSFITNKSHSSRTI